MDHTELVLLLEYPQFTRVIEENTIVYSGQLFVNDEDYKISITKSNGNTFEIMLPDSLTCFKAELDNLAEKLQPKNIVTILEGISTFIDSKIPATKLVDHSDTYRHVLYEYWDFTRFYLNIKYCCLAPDLSKVSISAMDQGGREHSFEVSVIFEDEEKFDITSYDLPQDKVLFKKSSSLKDVYNQFLGALDVFQPFFDAMDMFDGNCWILDPTEPKRSCAYRRIWIVDNFSVIVTLDPTNVSKFPEINFLGPERIVEEYRDALNAHIIDWEPRNSIFSEVLKLLGLESFPQRPAQVDRRPDLLMDAGDCSICFGPRLNDKLPEVVCKNKSCEKCYHAECLYEWLMSVNARRFFSEVVGLCPNCEKNISCPIPR